MLAPITVNTISDDVIPDGFTTLREAVAAAASAGDTINFALNPNSTITLDRTKGEIPIFGKSLTINGGTLGITINGNDPTPLNRTNQDGIRIFKITDPTNGTNPPRVTMVGLTLKGADPSGASGVDGGAIQSAGLLTLRDMTIRENGAAFGGGVFVAVQGNGTTTQRQVLKIENSKIENNFALLNGGGVQVRFSTVSGDQHSVSINGSSISNNTAGASYRGGALYVDSAGQFGSHSVVARSTHFDGNSAGIGGAIALNASAKVSLSVLQDSVISGNTAFSTSGNNGVGGGGGIYASMRGGSELRVEKSEISVNRSYLDGGGIAIRPDHSASLTISESKVSGNTAHRDGGGVYAFTFNAFGNPFAATRAITISKSVVSNNTAFDRGGGIFTDNREGTETLIDESRITGNVADSEFGFYKNGGGIYAYFRDDSPTQGPNKPRYTITRSTVDHNDADQKGGGIFVCAKFGGAFIATNTTISENRTLDSSSGAGGGMMIAREHGTVDAFLRNVTVTKNRSKDGGGVNAANLVDVKVQIANSIISENFDHEGSSTADFNNLVGRVDIATSKYNLVGTGSAVLNLSGQSATLDSTNISSDAPLLNPLHKNGGLAPTHSPKPGSPVIDKGSNTLASDPLTSVAFTTDQRGTGFPRPIEIPNEGNGAGLFTVDIGAHEVGLARVVDVQLDNPIIWARDAYSFAELVALGQQYRPIATGNVNTISIHFSEHVRKNGAGSGDVSNLDTTDGNLLTLFRSIRNPSNGRVINDIIGSTAFSYDPSTHVATWTFPRELLRDGKFAISLAAHSATTGGIVDNYGNSLDSNWNNAANGTYDAWGDDQRRAFIDGDGVAGSVNSKFRFNFCLLTGDYNGDGIVTTLDDAVAGDGDGDGVAGGQADYNIRVTQTQAFAELPLRRTVMDLNDDEWVDALDTEEESWVFSIWHLNNGSCSVWVI